MTINREADNIVAINDQKVIQEATNYFTISSLCKWSVKKTKTMLSKINDYFDIKESLESRFHELSLVMGVSQDDLEKSYKNVIKGFQKLPSDVYVLKKGYGLYPPLLSKTKEAPDFLFMQGDITLASRPAVAVVGTRNPSADGVNKARALASLLGKYRIVVASGLAKGIDRAAHEGALESNTPTIAVLGTPITKAYPKENEKLQQIIGSRGLLVSQFHPSAPVNRWNFPMRNAVMSGLCLATVVVEAGETSGALIQADYAIKQDRFVFIPQSAIDNQKLIWPKKYVEQRGAFSFSRIDELIAKLEDSKVIDSPRSISLLREEGNRYVH